MIVHVCVHEICPFRYDLTEHSRHTVVGYRYQEKIPLLCNSYGNNTRNWTSRHLDLGEVIRCARSILYAFLCNNLDQVT